MNIKVKLRDIDEELMFKSLDIEISSTKKFKTPIKASDPDFRISEINEIVKSFKQKSIQNALENENIERKYDGQIKRKIRNGINFVIIKYDSLEIPNLKEVEFLADMQYSRSDVVITPLWTTILRKTTGEDLINTFLELTNSYIEIIETLNHKSIIGIIPSKIPRIYMEDIIQNYHDKGIKSFILDMDGRGFNNNMPWVRNLWRSLKEYDMINDSFIYTINANQGRFLKQKKSILAKDFMNLGFGVDIIGLNHVPLRMPTEQWNKIKAQRKPNTFRVFNKETYGYLRISEPDARKIRISSRKDMKGFNIQEQYNESSVLVKKIRENTSITPYISDKKEVDENILKKIKKLRKNTF